MDLILGHKIDLVIDTPSQGVEKAKDGFIIRRNAIETGVNVLTSLDIHILRPPISQFLCCCKVPASL